MNRNLFILIERQLSAGRDKFLLCGVIAMALAIVFIDAEPPSTRPTARSPQVVKETASKKLPQHAQARPAPSHDELLPRITKAATRHDVKITSLKLTDDTLTLTTLARYPSYKAFLRDLITANPEVQLLKVSGSAGLGEPSFETTIRLRGD